MFLLQNGRTKYWLTEVESPTYIENGTTKHYNLLSGPVEVEVNANSGNENSQTVKIINKKSFLLPNTGGIGTLTVSIIGICLMVVAISIKLNRKRGGN